MADGDAGEDNEGLDVHLGMDARVLLVVLEPTLDGHLAVHVELALLHVVVVGDDLVLVAGHALELADVVLVERRLASQGVVRVEELRAVAASLDPDHVAAGVARHEAGDVVHLLVHDHPAVLGGGVLLHIGGGVLARLTARSDQGAKLIGGVGARGGGLAGRHRARLRLARVQLRAMRPPRRRVSLSRAGATREGVAEVENPGRRSSGLSTTEDCRHAGVSRNAPPREVSTRSPPPLVTPSAGYFFCGAPAASQYRRTESESRTSPTPAVLTFDKFTTFESFLTTYPLIETRDKTKKGWWPCTRGYLVTC